jgi:hypothetical protein
MGMTRERPANGQGAQIFFARRQAAGFWLSL